MVPQEPDGPKVFDVSHPSQSKPSATSRPVIVGHRPMPADPMVTHRPNAPQPLKPVAAAVPGINPEEVGHEPQAPESQQLQDPAEPILPAAETTTAHSTKKRPKMHWWDWVVLAIIVLFLAAYLAIDSGLLKADINLPFHIFKQDTTELVISSTPTPVAPVAPTLPANWATYQNKDIGYKFSYPKNWGVPVATNKAFEVYKFSKQESVLLDVGTKVFCPQGDAPQTKTSQGWYEKTDKLYLTWCKYSTDWDGKDYPADGTGYTVVKVAPAAIVRSNPKVPDQSGTATHAEVESIFNLSKNKTYSGLSLYRAWTAADKLDNTAVIDEFKQVAATYEEL